MHARDTLWWQVYPLGAVGNGPTGETDAVAPLRGDGDGGGLRALLPWLDHIIELGLNGLALGPVFASSTHGYDTTDHFTIDPRLGDQADFDALVAACHERGIALLLDGVFNHVGDQHPLFRRAVAEGPGGDTSEFFHLYWNQGDGPGTVPDYECFEGHRPLVTLNHASERVVDLVADAMCHWLDRGADGWRLDAAYAVPSSFWAAVLSRVRARHPECYIVGEVIHGDYPQIVRDTGMDAVTQYELWKSIWSSLNDRNLHELTWNLSRHNEFLDTFVPWTFIGNHDTTRIASKLNDQRLLPHATVLLALLPGSPAVYYGDEFGWTGVKEDRAGGDDAVRPPLPASPTEAVAEAGHGLIDLYRELIALRRRHPWLHTARTEVAEVSNTMLCLRLRVAEGETGSEPIDEHDELTVGLNLGEIPVTLPVSGAVLAGVGLSEAPHDQPRTVGAFGWAILQPRGFDT